MGGGGGRGEQECVHIRLCSYDCMGVNVTFVFPDRFRLLSCITDRMDQNVLYCYEAVWLWSLQCLENIKQDGINISSSTVFLCLH